VEVEAQLERVRLDLGVARQDAQEGIVWW